MRALAIMSGLAFASTASAQVVEDQYGLADDLFAGIAVISAQSCGQVITTGISGTLDSIDLQIWKSTGAINDVTIRVLSVTGGVPDPVVTGTLYETTIPNEDLPIFDGIPDGNQLPLTNVDLSAGGLDFKAGDQFAIGAFRIGQGAPPWVLWGQGNPNYANGDGYVTNDEFTWNVLPSAFGFRTFVDIGGGGCEADCNDDGELNILDFVCFQGLFQAGDDAADCNGDGMLNVLDFVCFQGVFQKGC